MDPRWYQIAALGGLLVWGVLGLEFDVSPPRIALLLGSVLATQWIATRLAKLPVFEPRSALISGLSLCLLLRTDSLVLAILAAVIAVGSKFVVRWHGKHLFNPTNIAIVVLLLATDRVWVSPGQWGNVTWFAFAIACLGSLVVTRARRADVTLAFLLFWAVILFARSAWLGQPSAVPLYRLQNGALLLFSFFMISDPRTTPDSRPGRILFALLVALGTGFVHFVLYRTNGLLWSLAVCSFVVPLIDRWLPGGRYAWEGRRCAPTAEGDPMQRLEGNLEGRRAAALGPALFLALGVLLAPLGTAWSFCGFYVAKADAKLYNKASRVVLVRDGDRTVITMAADYKGEPKDFAMVVPVPTVLEREQVHVADPALVERIDDFTAPRLVEYHDPNPCERIAYRTELSARAQAAPAPMPTADAMGLPPKVTIEAQYTVEEYDILILSARESDALETWLRENDYKIPPGAARVLGSYLKQGMKFFVAKVNLKEHSALGFTSLRPLQIAYENPKFVLPVRLGMVNADGPQELFVYALTRNGRIEATNYRTVRIPSNVDLPPYVKVEFAKFYTDMFAKQVQKEDMRAVFLEHAWDTGSCDPCAAEPLDQRELRALGVMWLDEGGSSRWDGASGTFVTRLHVRYDAAHFPEDLVLQLTGNRENFQGRYVLRHPWTGGGDCSALREYRKDLQKRQLAEAQTLASLTGWDEAEIRERAGIRSDGSMAPDKWWRRLWGD